MSKVEGRGPIDPPLPLCLRVTFFTLCLLGLKERFRNFPVFKKKQSKDGLNKKLGPFCPSLVNTFLKIHPNIESSVGKELPFFIYEIRVFL